MASDERRLRLIAGGGESADVDLDDAVDRARDVLLDAFDRYDRRHDGPPVAVVEADAVADERLLGELDVPEVFSLRVSHGVLKAGHASEATPPVPPLTADEIDHYGWLIGGLLDGAFVLATRQCPDLSSVPRAIDAAREIVDELMARLVPAGDR